MGQMSSVPPARSTRQRAVTRIFRTGSAAGARQGLGRAGDPRNLQLLRSALRSETEPALRLAIAECVYLSDPDGETSRRTFLEAIPADPRIFGRLWAAGAAEDPRPVLASLGQGQEGVGYVGDMNRISDLEAGRRGEWLTGSQCRRGRRREVGKRR